MVSGTLFGPLKYDGAHASSLSHRQAPLARQVPSWHLTLLRGCHHTLKRQASRAASAERDREVDISNGEGHQIFSRRQRR